MGCGRRGCRVTNSRFPRVMVSVVIVVVVLLVIVMVVVMVVMYWLW